jgi:hypothetical protein
MKLIRELTEEVSVSLSESADENGKKSLFIEGVFLQANKKNKNGRIYPSHIMEAEVQRYIKEKVDTNRAYGELGHPNGPQINMHLVSHIIKELRKDGDNYIGKAVITEGTPNGAIVRGLLDAGANLGVSSRGLGSLIQRNGIMEVQSDFRLSTAADIVGDPSAPDAFVRGLMEDVEWICENGVWTPVQVDAAKAHVNAAVRSRSTAQREATALGLFEHFMGTLARKS